MSDYQAIYDAVRSRISGGDIGSAIRDVASSAFDWSHERAILLQEYLVTATEAQRPSVLYRPELMAEGDKWMALYGPDLAVGVAGFGDTPAEAMAAFDAAWRNEKTPAAKFAGAK